MAASSNIANQSCIFQHIAVAQTLSDSHLVQDSFRTATLSHTFNVLESPSISSGPPTNVYDDPKNPRLLSGTPVIFESATNTPVCNEQALPDGEWDKTTIVVDAELENEFDSLPEWEVESRLPGNIPFLQKLILNAKSAIKSVSSWIMCLSTDGFFGLPSLRSASLFGKEQTLIHWLEACLPLWVSHHIRFWLWLHEQMYWRKSDER